MSRIFLTLMTSTGNEENLVEIVSPIIDLLDGLVVVFHRENDTENDAGMEFLEKNKKHGKVIYRHWVNRHDFSMNETLFSGVLQDGDLVLYCDTLERPIREFIQNITIGLDNWMKQHNVDIISYYGKPYLFRYNEGMYYEGSPHWALRGGIANIMEWSHVQPDESRVRLNVRPQKRTNEFQWVEHYAKYFLYPARSNHCLLGLEANGDPQKLFGPREQKRLEFRREMKKRGFSTNLNGLKEMLSLPIDERLRDMINSDKVWQDYYRYEIMGDKSVIHSHSWKDMKSV